jgi:hypothetical protein
MPGHDDKRQLRKHKKVVKRDGSKHRRRAFKEGLRDNPAEAHLTAEDLGRNVSRDLNGLDRPADGRT